MSTYPKDWPKCPNCGDDAMDGHITCGRSECNEGAACDDYNARYGVLPEKKSAADRRWESVNDGIDWNDTSRPEVQRAIREEREEQYDRDEGDVE